MVSRTAFTQLHYSWMNLAGTFFGMLFLYLWAPFLVIDGVLKLNLLKIVFGIILWIIPSSLYIPTVRFYGLSLWYSAALPAIALFYASMTIHSALRHWMGKGSQWKDRYYPALN